jgi:uncharacterized Zn finger protein
MKTKHIHCDECGNLTETRFVSKQMKRRGKFYKFDSNAEVCPNCGNVYFNMHEALEFEKFVKQQEQIVLA